MRIEHNALVRKLIEAGRTGKKRKGRSSKISPERIRIWERTNYGRDEIIGSRLENMEELPKGHNDPYLTSTAIGSNF